MSRKPFKRRRAPYGNAMWRKAPTRRLRFYKAANGGEFIPACIRWASPWKLIMRFSITSKQRSRPWPSSLRKHRSRP